MTVKQRLEREFSSEEMESWAQEVRRAFQEESGDNEELFPIRLRFSLLQNLLLKICLGTTPLLSGLILRPIVAGLGFVFQYLI